MGMIPSGSAALPFLRGVNRLAEAGLGLVREPSRALGVALQGAAADYFRSGFLYFVRHFEMGGKAIQALVA